MTSEQFVSMVLELQKKEQLSGKNVLVELRDISRQFVCASVKKTPEKKCASVEQV